MSEFNISATYMVCDMLKMGEIFFRPHSNIKEYFDFPKESSHISI